MSNPIPLTENEIDEIFSKFEPHVKENFEIFLDFLVNWNEPDYFFTDDDEPMPEKMKKEICDMLKEELGVKGFYENMIVFENLNLVFYNGEYFKLVDVEKTEIVEITNGNKDTFYLSKEGYINLGKDALDRLSRGG